MLCGNCAKLATLQTNKACPRCQGAILNNLSVICDICSANNKQCSVCLKKVAPAGVRNASRGCNCGRK